MKELVERLFQVDFLKGMRVTFKTQHPDNIYTEQYPLERPMVAERFRGAPRLNKNPETGETLWYRVQPVHPGMPGEFDRGWMGTRRRNAP